jgi:very-short-patch-repair endonuclease
VVSTTGGDAACAATAATQGGLISRRQARAAGLSSSQIRKRLDSRRWELVLPGIYRIRGAPASSESELWTAVLWAAERCAVSFGAAARRHGFQGYEDASVEISVARNIRNHGLPFRVHRCDHHLLEQVVLLGRMPVTSIPRTLMDLAGRREWRAEKALDQMLRERRATLGEIWLLYDLEWTRGRRGIAILKSWLLQRSPHLAPTDSALEERLWRLIGRAADIPLPVTQHQVATSGGMIRFDFAYPELLLAIEADSYAWHGDREAFDRDRRRDAEVAAMGWLVLRFTWAQIMFDEDHVLRSLRTQLQRRALTR